MGLSRRHYIIGTVIAVAILLMLQVKSFDIITGCMGSLVLYILIISPWDKDNGNPHKWTIRFTGLIAWLNLTFFFSSIDLKEVIAPLLFMFSFIASLLIHYIWRQKK